MPINLFPTEEELLRPTHLEELLVKVEERSRIVGLSEEVILEWTEGIRKTFLTDNGRLPNAYLKHQKSWETLEMALRTLVSCLNSNLVLSDLSCRFYHSTE